LNETTLAGGPPDAAADTAAAADDDGDGDGDSGDGDNARGMMRPSTRPTLSRRAESARLHERSP
jgi:hypothetical protein